MMPSVWPCGVSNFGLGLCNEIFKAPPRLLGGASAKIHSHRHLRRRGEGHVEFWLEAVESSLEIVPIRA